MRSITCIVALVVLTVLPAYLHGRLLHRWGIKPQTLQLAKTVDEFPAQLGAWKATTTEGLAQWELDSLQVTADLSRVYRHEETGKEFSLSLLVGAPRELLVHSPMVCYAGRGDQKIGQTEIVDNGSDRFFLWRYRPSGGLKADFIVLHALSSGGEWKATETPRWDMGGSTSVVNLQILLSDPDGDAQTIAQESVLPAFLETWREIVGNQTKSQNGPTADESS